MTIFDFISEQPHILTQTIRQIRERVAELECAGAERIVLVGSGSSFNALTSTAFLFEASRLPVNLVGPAFFVGMPASHGKGSLVVVLSQSGRSTTSVEAARMALQAGCRVIGVTADPKSEFAKVVGDPVLLPIGEEPIGPKTKGYSASLTALIEIAAKLGDSQNALPFSEKAFTDHVAESRQSASLLAQKLDDVDCIMVSGSGSLFGAALEGSLKIAEIAGIPTAAFEQEELLHGRLHGLGPRGLAVMIAANEPDLKLAEHTASVMAERGGRVVVLNLAGRAGTFDWRHKPQADARLALIDAVVPFQWLAVELALRRHMDPEVMRYPGLSQALAIKLRG